MQGRVNDVKPKLEIQGLSRHYDGRVVVDGVSLSIAAGQVTCLLGPSGCGKSTTLRMIAGVEKQDAGSILVDGQVISDGVVDTPPERRSIGLMFQDFALFPHLTVARNISFGLNGSASQNRDRVDELLGRIGLSKRAESHPHELSGGEQQRVALARALAPRPQIMLMDEPFSGLDERLKDGIRDATLGILKDEGTAVLLVTHEPAEAMRMADDIALMRDGKIVQQGAPYNIYNTPVDKMSAAFFSDINVIHGKVHGALVKTAFGDFLAPGHSDGTALEIIIRPQHLRMDFDRSGVGPNPTPQDGVPARGVVQRARFMGRESLVEFKMDYDGSVLKSTVPSVFLPKVGTALWLMIRRERCYVFPAML
ncbi:MAG: ABC transporter ATP-binding protein [Paracoccaceae bacterium]